MALAQWPPDVLINGRNLKTTMQKGFKYHLGYQMLAAWSGSGMRLRAVYLGQTKVWEAMSPEKASATAHSSFLLITMNCSAVRMRAAVSSVRCIFYLGAILSRPIRGW